MVYKKGFIEILNICILGYSIYNIRKFFTNYKIYLINYYINLILSFKLTMFTLLNLEKLNNYKTIRSKFRI